MELLSVGALAASSSSRMLRFDSLARKLKLASARPLGAPYVGTGLRQPYDTVHKMWIKLDTIQSRI